MDNLIIYGIVAAVVIANIIRTYKKEAEKNKERVLTQPVRPATPPAPAPFSRPQRVEEPPRNTENTQVPQSTPTMRSASNFADEGVSAIQRHINSQAKSAFKDDEHFMKDEDSSQESFDLKLDSNEDFRRAFVHTLIFERKY